MAGVVMLYAAYNRTMDEMNVHVPNVRAERAFEGLPVVRLL